MINNNISVLAVEDEPINQMVLKTFFKQFNLPNEVVGTGLEALNLIKNRHSAFHLIFLDLGLPDTTGITVAQHIRAYEATQDLEPLYICALTADDAAEKEQECLAAGMNMFLTKPISMEQISSILQLIGLRDNAVV